jgi:hypothetical protein
MGQARREPPAADGRPLTHQQRRCLGLLRAGRRDLIREIVGWQKTIRSLAARGLVSHDTIDRINAH